jgi:hypothetical protein
MSTVDHFAHLETNGDVVDLFWNRGSLDEVRVEVANEREGARFVLHRLPGGRQSTPSITPSRRVEPRSMTGAWAA